MEPKERFPPDPLPRKAVRESFLLPFVFYHVLPLKLPPLSGEAARRAGGVLLPRNIKPVDGGKVSFAVERDIDVIGAKAHGVRFFRSV